MNLSMTSRMMASMKNGFNVLVLSTFAFSVLAQDATLKPATDAAEPAVTPATLAAPATTEAPDAAVTPATAVAPTEATPSTTVSDSPAPVAADSTTEATSGEAAPAEAPSTDASASSEFKTLDQDVQTLKKDVLDLNRELFVLEEELLYPADTQVAFFVSMDVGAFFGLDTITLKVDNKEVANYLYTARETQALLKGGVQRVYVGNLKVGEHELVAFFTGKGPNQRDYKRGTSVKFTKGVGAKYLELKISDKVIKEQPEFIVKEWE